MLKIVEAYEFNRVIYLSFSDAMKKARKGNNDPRATGMNTPNRILLLSDGENYFRLNEVSVEGEI